MSCVHMKHKLFQNWQVEISVSLRRNEVAVCFEWPAPATVSEAFRLMAREPAAEFAAPTW